VSQKFDISIISSGANLADARLHRLTRALARAGLRVEIFAPGALKDAPQTEDTSQTLVIRKPWFAAKWSNKSLIARYYRSRLFALRAHGRVLYAISPEAVAPSFARAKFSGRKLAVDFFEDYLRLLKDRNWATKFFGIPGWIAKSDTRSALWFARRADLTTVADVQVPPFDARNRLVVRNLPDLSLLTKSGERGLAPRAIYIGDLRKSRGLHAMLRIAEISPDWEFDFVGGIASADQQFVDHWFAKNSSAISRVRFHGKLPLNESWKFAVGAWVGLSLLEPTPAFIEAIPSKLYEYMSVGLASISSPLPRCVELHSLSNFGAIESTPEEVAARLEYWKRNPHELDQIRGQVANWTTKNLNSEQEYLNFASEMAKLTR
jgi:glycosyltransferase involved in cell wall biosynthesis